jgi:TPR repeat protein
MKRLTLACVLILLQATAACTDLGKSSATGEVVPQDYGEAARWFRRAAEQGHAEAQYNLGLLYGNGQGVPYDYGAAVGWTRLAAEQGDPLAQYNLGVLYHNGEGVAQDVVESHMWLNLAAEGLPPGEERDKVVIIRDEIARLMTLAQILEAQRLAREWRPRAQ